MAFDINQHLQQIGFGRGGEQQTGDGLANEKESPEIIVEGIKKIPSNTVKMLELIPVIGPFLAGLIPLNAGEVSALSSFETQGITGKNIVPVQGGTRGGALYAALAPLIKNSAITDQTGGSGGGGADGSAMAGGGGEAFLSLANFGEMAGAGGGFEWTSVSMASLGELPRPVTPDASTGAGMEIS